MSQYGDDLVFDGANGLTGGTFVRNIRQQALSKGFPDDDKLIAHTAASYFDGAALDWYESLEEETQESWKLLRRALLARYPANQTPSSALGSTAPAPAPASVPARTVAPTPAAAPPAPPPKAPPPPPPLPSRNSSQSSTSQLLPAGPLVGRIKVRLVAGNIPFGYVARYADKDGDYNTTTNPSEALIVQITCSEDPHGIKIQSNGLGNEWLGIVLPDADSDQRLSTQAIGATLLSMRLASDYDAYAGVLSAPSSHKGARRAAVWNVLMDGTIQVTWKASQTVMHRLSPVVIAGRQKEGYGELGVFNGYEGSLDSHPAFVEKGLRGAQMTFEPM